MGVQKDLTGSLQSYTSIKDMRKNVYFLSNNSFFTRTEIANSLVSRGSAANVNNMFNISYCAALYLSKQLKPGAKILSIGLSGFSDELSAAGFDVIRGESMHQIEFESVEELENMKIENLEAVVVGRTLHLTIM